MFPRKLISILIKYTFCYKQKKGLVMPIHRYHYTKEISRDKHHCSNSKARFSTRDLQRSATTAVVDDEDSG
ncbi:hypothetical protein HanXRQr2_Chr17g0790411 [Helianthus annuus]|uniref:Uncharacterized protein n=1 Tax=Helianthus annuus TaxID=4232 RepID=A0A9K3DIC1_HELAN|nr:hypothetical protein HanXRQr2_Chr17g0790411 [Helianthus annuus]KAJ0830103.1 hypothetical protein HanPSC8_Chr15g0651371 [Helianthus annuus]